MCCVSTNANKFYRGTADGDFQKRYYNHKTSFKNKHRENAPAISK